MRQAFPERAAEPKPIILFLDHNLDMLALYQAYFLANGYPLSAAGSNALRPAGIHPVTFAVLNIPF